jgi:hypothetical protein
MRPAKKFHLAPRLAAAPAEAQRGESERWPRGARILFLLAAALLCWAVR